MIIFGTSVKRKTISSGQFYCPRCQATRAYDLKKAKRYISFYFIPVIPIGELGDFVECQTCGAAFEAGVLNMKAPQKQVTLAEMLNSTKERLTAGAPIEYVVRDLTAAGLDRTVALAAVDSAIGSSRNICHTCGLTYANIVQTCAECGQPLSSS